MLFLKNSLALFLLPLLICCSCSSPKEKELISPAIPDTAVLIGQFNRYDSISNLYFKSYDIDFLKPAGDVADSVLSYPFELMDSSLQERYLALLLYRATDLNDLKDFIKSRDLYERYIFLYQQKKLLKPLSLAYAQTYLGNIYSRYGDYVKASSLLRQGKKYYMTGKSQDNKSFSLLNLSIPLKELNQYREAENLLLEIFDFASVSHKRKAKACIELADIYTRQNKLAEAGIKIQKAKQFLDSVPLGSDRTETFTILFKIEGDWQMADHQPAKALNTYRQSLDSAKISSAQNLRSREIGKIYIAMGNAMEQLDIYDSVLYYYNRALYTVINIDTLNDLSLPHQKDLYAENTIAEALFARAECISKHRTENVQELENAVSCWQLAFETEKKLLNAFSYDESRLFMVQENRHQVENAIGVCYRLYQSTKNQQWADEAFLFAEGNKSFVLNESVKRNIAASLFVQDDNTYKVMQSQQSQLASIDIELNNQKFSPSPDSGIIQTLIADKQKLEEALLQNENSVKIKNPQYADWLSSETILTAGEIINKIIAKSSAMVEYFAGDSAVYAFGGFKNKPLSFYKLSSDTKTASNNFLYFFSDRNLILNKPAEYAASANQLYEFLLSPLLTPGSSSLVIIPDGFISLIPFDALLTTPATSINIASFPFLIKQAEIAYAFSGRTILIQQQIKSNTGNDQLIAFAPVFSNNKRGFSTLSHSTEEILAIKELYPAGKFFTDTAATLRQFKINSTNASIIHLATHAGSGNDSSLACIEFYDSALYLNNIYAMPLKAKLVVLSGCETGAGAVNKTEGLMSLARGFSYAGTQNVVAGLWQTEDKTSGELFKDFYSNLSANSISGSLQKAKLQLIQNSSVSQASPFYWAGYIYIGIPGEKINTASGKNTILIFIAAILLLIGITVTIKKRNKINPVIL